MSSPDYAPLCVKQLYTQEKTVLENRTIQARSTTVIPMLSVYVL